jgi:hypothetical protein
MVLALVGKNFTVIRYIPPALFITRMINTSV